MQILVSVAKKDLSYQGEILDGEGGFASRGKLVTPLSEQCRKQLFTPWIDPMAQK